MITEKEQQLTELSATKKDFYQIWQELLDTAGKISERWDPTSTNESDPGIVLLKVLTGIADKLNYNIDKNTLEAFMPSAAQEESMRKLCDMMGYSMKYYRSATTNVTMYYKNSNDEWYDSEHRGNVNSQLVLPKFTQFTNIDKDIIYTSTEDVIFTVTGDETVKSVPCIEGTVKYCAEDTNGVINLNNIDDNNRYYLPITQVAENGLFVYNINNGAINQWKKIDNLNTQELGKRVFKFGYDSKRFLPYIEFPDDIGSLIEDGLSVAYVSTNGINGNVSAKTLVTFDTPSEWKNTDNNIYNTTGKEHTADEFICYNASASTGGTNKESLNDAYKNFKKTVGTFDTLVTCRDYMNKIYTLTKSETDTTPLVSNSIVSDIRDDINRSITICSFGKHGINYITRSDYNPATGTDKISHFDLILYPFQTVYGLNTKEEYDKSFKHADSASSRAVIQDVQIRNYKTIAHKLNLPEDAEIMCIKIYLELNAIITTNNKINSAEWNIVLDNIKKAIYKNFNCRQLDFSEEIPFDDILNTIENADINIKNVALEEPNIYASFMTADNEEYNFKVAKTSTQTIIDADTTQNAKLLYNQLAIRNILAGRVSLFNYNTDFKTNITETKVNDYDLVYPNTNTGTNNYIKNIKPRLTVYTNNLKDLKLTENQIIQFSAPNFRTEVAYPAYVNYFAKLNNRQISPAIPARFMFLYELLTKSETVGNPNLGSNNPTIEGFWTAALINKLHNTTGSNNYKLIDNEIEFNQVKSIYGFAFKEIQLWEASSIDLTSDNEYYLVEYDGTESFNKNKMTGNIYPITIDNYSDTDDTLNVTIQSEYEDSGNNSELIRTIPCKVSNGNVYTSTPNNTSNLDSIYLHEYVNITNETFAEDTYYYYPFNEYTYGAWTRLLSQQKHFIHTVTNIENNTTNTTSIYSTIAGLYKNLGSDSARNIGYLVDENRYKYALWSNYFTSTDPLHKYYIPLLHFKDKDTDGDDYGWTANGLGKDAVYQPLTKNMEYQLDSGECLYINYTKASSTVSEAGENSDANTLTTTNEIVNKYYGPGTIIRPNFDLKDSLELKNEGKSYSKTSGFDFEETNPPGMFSLGASEQIEIREQVKTFIYDPGNLNNSGVNPVYIYFNINKPADGNKITLMTAYGTDDSSYRLQEGEYFWYTDKNKQTLTYCGAGSELINHTNRDITKSIDDNISTAKIFEKGLSVIPWQAINGLYIEKDDNDNIKKDNNDVALGNYIEWDEYQYINLTAGDVLNNITLEEISSNQITNEPKSVKSATYTIDGVTNDLPNLAVGELAWKVNSKLAVNIGPSTYQMLTNKTSGDTSQKNQFEEMIELEFNAPIPTSGITTKSIEPASNQSLYVKSNYLINSTLDEINTTWKLYDEDTGSTEDEEVRDFKLKVFNNNPIQKTDKDGNITDLLINNLNNYYTSLSTANCIVKDPTTFTPVPFTRMYSTIDNTTNKYNLLMIYYETDTTDNISSSDTYLKYASIRIASSENYRLNIAGKNDNGQGNDTIQLLTIFNNKPTNSDPDKWWFVYNDQTSELTYRTFNREATAGSFTVESVTITNEESFNSEKNNLSSTELLCTRTEATPDIAKEGYLIERDNLSSTGYYRYTIVSEYTNGQTYYKISFNNELELGIDKDTIFCLKPGLNIIKIENFKSAVLEIYAGTTDGSTSNPSDTLVIGQLDTIKENQTLNGSTIEDTDLGINLDLLQYQYVSSNNTSPSGIKKLTAEQLLEQIRDIDTNHEFYYNTLLDNSLAININTLAGETLADPQKWYDYNNINNKFVISEIDSEYLKTGITLATSSRKK